MNPAKVTLYDTTLRDGTQGEGISFSVLDKIRVAERLDAFGIHYIEGGWPGANPKDIEFFVEARKRQWPNAKLAAFGRTRPPGTLAEKDPLTLDLLNAQSPVVTVFGKSWRLHVREVLKISEAENREMIADTVRFFKKNDREMIYDAEHFFDGFKDDAEHALATLAAARDAGADYIVLCDTNGGTLPEEVSQIMRAVQEGLGADVRVGIHTHNDGGLGVANALAAVREGACQVQGTINGYGERTGNCNLTTVIPNLQLKMKLDVAPDLTRLRALSQFVDELANLPHDIRAPFVGSTAFSHKAGVHANAVMKVAESYEHIRPESVGNVQHILISEQAGQSNVLMRLASLGYTIEKGSTEVKQVLEELKRLESEGYEFEAAEASFELLIRRVLGRSRSLFELQEYHCHYRCSGVHGTEMCEATVKLRVDGVPEYTVAEGDGPVNALDAALRKALRPFFPQIDEIQLQDYKVRIIDGQKGTAARTRVFIVSSDGQESWGTVGVSDNIIQASWLALVDSFEFKLLR